MSLSSTSDRFWLKCEKTNQYAYANLFLLKLKMMLGSTVMTSFDAVAGGPRHQNFHTARNSRDGSFEPLGEGLYAIEDIHWGGQPWDYSSLISPGLGFAGIRLHNADTKRSALEIHWDANRDVSPGTAGCIGLPTKDEMVRLLGYFKNDVNRPRSLVVDWELGSVKATDLE